MNSPAKPNHINASQAFTSTSIYTNTVFKHRHLLPSLALLITCAVSAPASSQPARPPATGSAPAARSSPPSAPSPATDNSSTAAAAKAIVMLEQADRHIGLGFVLAGDGRIVTSLSIIADGAPVRARYADGSMMNVKVGHSDNLWNLALLVPQVGRWETGLQASSADPFAEGAQIRVFSKKGRSLTSAPVVLKGTAEIHGGDGEVLHDAIEVSSVIRDADMGAPLVNEQGRAVGVVSSACISSEGSDNACSVKAFAVPMRALRSFLRSAPASDVQSAPWLGVLGVGMSAPMGGVRLVHIHKNSPAAAAHLQADPAGNESDIIIAVDGDPSNSAEELSEQIRSKAVGDTIQIIVLRGGKYLVVETTLAASPSSTSAAAPKPAPRPAPRPAPPPAPEPDSEDDSEPEPDSDPDAVPDSD